MANEKVMANVQVAVQSAIATAVTITAITKANPGVVSWSTGTDPANGDYILYQVEGMAQLNNRIVRGANLNGAGNTIELEGLNTTNFNTFTSGTLATVTFGQSLAHATDIAVSGGEWNFTDSSTIHDDVDTEIPTTTSPVKLDITYKWGMGDTAYTTMKAASDAKTKLGLLLTFADGTKWVVYGFVGCSDVPNGARGALVTTKITFTCSGKPIRYAT